MDGTLRGENMRGNRPNEAQETRTRKARRDADLGLGRCAGNREAESGACESGGIGNCRHFAQQRGRFDTTGAQLLIDRLMTDVADLAGRFGRAAMVMPYRRGDRSREQQEHSQSDRDERTRLFAEGVHGAMQSLRQPPV